MKDDQRGDDLVAGDAGMLPELEAGGGTLNLKEGVSSCSTQTFGRRFIIMSSARIVYLAHSPKRGEAHQNTAVVTSCVLPTHLPIVTNIPVCSLTK